MKLQQKIAMGLCAFYLISVIGIAMDMHFCSGKLSSVRFVEAAKCKACKEENKTEKAHGCCQSKTVDAKVKDSHEAGSNVKLPQNFSIELFLGPVVSNILGRFLPNLFHRIENKAPPLSSILSLHLYNCVFRN